jgi:hypothetical protein
MTPKNLRLCRPRVTLDVGLCFVLQAFEATESIKALDKEIPQRRAVTQMKSDCLTRRRRPDIAGTRLNE